MLNTTFYILRLFNNSFWPRLHQRLCRLWRQKIANGFLQILLCLYAEIDPNRFSGLAVTDEQSYFRI